MMKSILTAAGLAVLLTQPLLAGGAVDINWGNAGNLNGAMSTLFSDVAGTAKLSAGITNVAGDGYRLDLVAVQGGSNYVLATATIGDNPNALAGPGQLFAGKFDILSVVPSNGLAGASARRWGSGISMAQASSALFPMRPVPSQLPTGWCRPSPPSSSSRI